jgi:hypothetical protein
VIPDYSSVQLEDARQFCATFGLSSLVNHYVHIYGKLIVLHSYFRSILCCYNNVTIPGLDMDSKYTAITRGLLDASVNVEKVCHDQDLVVTKLIHRG